MASSTSRIGTVISIATLIAISVVKAKPASTRSMAA
jgi:hypothetical protein